jgi:chalcone isomerase
MIEGKFVKFTAIGVYFEEAIVPHLLLKWKDKTAEELSNTLDFYMDLVRCKFANSFVSLIFENVVTVQELIGFGGKHTPGPYEKVARVAFVSPLTGVEFCRKVSENCRIACESAGIYSEAEAKAIEQLKDVFKSKNFLPGYSILYTISPAGLVVRQCLIVYNLRIQFLISICFFAHFSLINW